MRTETIHSVFNPAGGAYVDVAELIRFRHATKEMDSLSLGRAKNPLAGMLSSPFRGRGIDFAEVRTYEPGDDVRTIDWKVTARTQIPHTKIFQEERERPILLLVDQSHSMFFGSKRAFKSVVAAEVAALLAWVSLANGDRIGGSTFNETHHLDVRPRRNKRSLLRLLNDITKLNQQLGLKAAGSAYTDNENLVNGQCLNEALINTRRVAKHGSGVVIISDFLKFDADSELHLRQLARHNSVIGVLVTDPMEAALPRPDVYTISDGTQKLEINTAISRFRTAHEHAFADRLSAVRNQFSRIKSPLISISTSDDLVPTVAKGLMEFDRVSSGG